MGSNFIIYSLLIIFIGASSADYISRRKKGYFIKNGYAKWAMGRVAILCIIIAIWYFAIK